MKLTITDKSKLKITKVKDWAIYFTYCDEKYLLHESTDCYDSVVTLYKRLPVNDNGKYELEWLHSNPYSDIPTIEYKKKNKYWTGTNSQVNIDKFVYDLTKDGFFESEYEKEIKKKSDPINKKKAQIAKLEEEIRILEGLRGEK